MESASALIPLLKYDDKIRLEAMNVLTITGRRARKAIPEVVAALDDESIRVYAIEILQEIGPDARAAVPALQELLTVQDQSVRTCVAQALQAIKR
jgi:HEAT repeat protein